MAIFEGTIQEFHHFLGPRMRNAVNALTRKCRIEKQGICEECGQKRELHSAHIHGEERRTIIEKILETTICDGRIRCDLETIEKIIIDAHLPIENIFKFLCHSCHVVYDSQTLKAVSKSTNTEKSSHGFAKLHRIKLWANRSHQDNHKIIMAFLKLEKQGVVCLDELKNLCESNPNYSVKKFDGHYASMKTDAGNSHGNVFYDEDGIVSVWPRVREEIAMHFERTG